MKTTTKKLVKLSPQMAKDAEMICQSEERTFTDLVREALRHYIRDFHRARGAVPNPLFDGKASEDNHANVN